MILFFWFFWSNYFCGGLCLGVSDLFKIASPFSNFSSRSSRQNNEPDADTATVKCFGELGCVENTEEWFHLLRRPINFLPVDLDRIHTRFILYHRNRSVDPEEVYINRTHLIEHDFDPKKPVKFVAHGFIDTGFSFWVTKLAQALLQAGDFNVIVVDWGRAALPMYTQATANTRLVGLQIANYIQFLQREFQVKAGDIHCIGHSLGSHVCGYAGEKVRGMGRITGLDPAEPYFQYMPEKVRLDPSDAKFVDIIHSDGRTYRSQGFGMTQPCGHVDFYPNDGKEQPGCEPSHITSSVLNAQGYDRAQRDLFACNHHRAVYYFIEAVLNRCQYIGHMCDDYYTYLKGECWSCGSDGSNCAMMGLDADKYQIGNRSLLAFYVSTAKAAPFCVRHYRVNLQLALPQQADQWVQGMLKVNIIGGKSSTDVNLTPTDPTRFQHGTDVTFVVQSSKKMGEIKQVEIDWKYDLGLAGIVPGLWGNALNNKLFVKKVEIMDIDDMDRSRTDLYSVHLCGEGGTKYTGIPSGSQAIFDRPCREFFL